MLGLIKIKIMSTVNQTVIFIYKSIQLLGFVGVSNFTIAADEQRPSVEFNSGLNIDSLLQVFTALLAIILIIVALSYILRKFNMVPGGATGLIKVISGLSLNSKDRLLLIQVGDEQILLSVSPGNINKVHKLSNLVSTEPVSIANKENKFSKLLESVVTRQQK